MVTSPYWRHQWEADVYSVSAQLRTKHIVSELAITTREHVKKTFAAPAGQNMKAGQPIWNKTKPLRVLLFSVVEILKGESGLPTDCCMLRCQPSRRYDWPCHKGTVTVIIVFERPLSSAKSNHVQKKKEVWRPSITAHFTRRNRFSRWQWEHKDKMRRDGYLHPQQLVGTAHAQKQN